MKSSICQKYNFKQNCVIQKSLLSVTAFSIFQHENILFSTLISSRNDSDGSINNRHNNYANSIVSIFLYLSLHCIHKANFSSLFLFFSFFNDSFEEIRSRFLHPAKKEKKSPVSRRCCTLQNRSNGGCNDVEKRKTRSTFYLTGCCCATRKPRTVAYQTFLI